jgi:hypothetical protein
MDTQKRVARKQNVGATPRGFVVYALLTPEGNTRHVLAHLGSEPEA